MAAHGCSARRFEIGDAGSCLVRASALLGRMARNICSGDRFPIQPAVRARGADPVVAKGEGLQCRKVQMATEREFAQRYRVGKQVMECGNKGMAVLFATRRTDCHEEVVVKSRQRRGFQASFSGPTEESDWRRSMEALMSLPRAGTLCELMEVIETPYNYYVVMEKIHGQDLFETMLREKFDVSDARAVLRQLLEGLSILHGAGLIHNDIKMENVMFRRSASRDGAKVIAKIIDFDTVSEWRPSGPKARTVVGTDGYIAPEGYRGSYSPASDVYAAGVVMYALLTGKIPFRSDMFDTGLGEGYVGSPAMERIHDHLRRHQINFEIGELGACAQAADLCKSLLAHDAGSRPSVERALEHAWFSLPLQSTCEQPPSNMHEAIAAKRHDELGPSFEKCAGVVCSL